MSSTPFFDTWEWDGIDWVQKLTTTNPGAPGGSMAYYPPQQRTVLFGGISKKETWEWDGSTWTQRFPGTNPPVASAMPLIYDTARQRIVFYGQGETWEWDGSNWSKRLTVTNPSGTDGSAYDIARDRIVTVGDVTYLHGPITRAGGQEVGVGCAGTNGIPLLTSNAPFLGSTRFDLDLVSARPSSGCSFFLADQQQNLALGAGCSVYVNGVIAALPVTTNAGGFATIRLAVPFEQSLRGVALYGQVVVLDPLGALGGFAFTGGRRLSIGD